MAQRIVRLSTFYDLPFDTTGALEFALFRTFAAGYRAGACRACGQR